METRYLGAVAFIAVGIPKSIRIPMVVIMHAYNSQNAHEAAANKEDLIIWPPIVLIHNTNIRKRKYGRMDGVGNKQMDIELKDLIEANIFLESDYAIVTKATFFHPAKRK
ncbi:hypothetical protein CKAN_01090100 [Cinnamomum micranthum f. kanehirae]|uniref:Uncharacterized protein n=1 Tax=Cinnamomum micranthum f. kanehirae TaxID=337451 RepID=A0A3S3P3M1_9MAGN|nr:hypothetical protein CKAN_01090100 [Cinnamomum micranthum f. kanehirae]